MSDGRGVDFGTGPFFQTPLDKMLELPHVKLKIEALLKRDAVIISPRRADNLQAHQLIDRLLIPGNNLLVGQVLYPIPQGSIAQILEQNQALIFPVAVKLRNIHSNSLKEAVQVQERKLFRPIFENGQLFARKRQRAAGRNLHDNQRRGCISPTQMTAIVAAAGSVASERHQRRQRRLGAEDRFDFSPDQFLKGIDHDVPNSVRRLGVKADGTAGKLNFSRTAEANGNFSGFQNNRNLAAAIRKL